MVLGLVIVSLVSGVGVTVFGYCKHTLPLSSGMNYTDRLTDTPWMIAGSVLMSIGFGLLTTFTPDISFSKWLGYQALAGIGVGLGMQQPLMAVQTVLDITDVPTGTSLLIFLQTLGGALFVSVGQNVFTNKLVSGLAEFVPSLDPLIVLSVGATSIQHSEFITAADLPGVTLAYNNALVQTFTVATAMAAASIIGSLAIEWKSVKGKNIEMAAA
jgi:hypothetical protein